jgi:hypothetical protein
MKQLRKIGIPILLGIYVYLLGVSLMPHHHCHSETICFDSVSRSSQEHHSCCSSSPHYDSDCENDTPLKCNDIHCVSKVVYYGFVASLDNGSKSKVAENDVLYLLCFWKVDELLKTSGWNDLKLREPDYPPILYRDICTHSCSGFRAPPLA